MSFIFDANETPQQRELRKNQRIAQALRAGASQPATDLGSGIASLGDAIAYKAMQNRQGGAPSAPAQAAMGAGWDGFGGMSPQQQAAASPAGGFSLFGRLFGR